MTATRQPPATFILNYRQRPTGPQRGWRPGGPPTPPPGDAPSGKRAGGTRRGHQPLGPDGGASCGPLLGRVTGATLACVLEGGAAHLEELINRKQEQRAPSTWTEAWRPKTVSAEMAQNKSCPPMRSLPEGPRCRTPGRAPHCPAAPPLPQPPPCHSPRHSRSPASAGRCSACLPSPPSLFTGPTPTRSSGLILGQARHTTAQRPHRPSTWVCTQTLTGRPPRPFIRIPPMAGFTAGFGACKRDHRMAPPDVATPWLLTGSIF